MNTNMTYEQLYNNVAKHFIIDRNKVEYKLGDYMLIKAKNKHRSEKNSATEKASSCNTSNLPAGIYSKESGAGTVSSIISYVNEKLTVKEAPIKDKTIRNFPLRTSLTAFCSALVVCALVISCGIFGLSAVDYENTAKANYDELPEANIEISETLSNFNE